MFATESRWHMQQNMLIIKITGSAQLFNNSAINAQIETQLISKITNVILGAEKFHGKALSVVPHIPTEPNTFVVCTSIIFSSQSDIEEFKKECPKILYQG